MYVAKHVIDLKASDVVRQPKIVDTSRGVTKDSRLQTKDASDSGSRLRSSETAPDGFYSRNSADGESVGIGVEWSGGDVRLFCDNMCFILSLDLFTSVASQLCLMCGLVV